MYTHVHCRHGQHEAPDDHTSSSLVHACCDVHSAAAKYAQSILTGPQLKTLVLHPTITGTELKIATDRQPFELPDAVYAGW